MPLPTALARELELHFQRTAFTGDEDLVFCHPHTGKPYDGSKALKRYKAACALAGVTKTNRLHDLRHTFGSRWLRAMCRCGHSRSGWVIANSRPR
ncbi:MAG TPA: hypothetical protein VGW75_10755 [Solirubrobacteraceae bacterium]|nr:hypothetical protein [Solirubrobacteraceae bacterium]